MRERGVCSLAEAVRRLSACRRPTSGWPGGDGWRRGASPTWSCSTPDAIADRASYEHPHQYATGVRAVLVNGSVAVRDGKFAGPLAGRHSRRNRAG